MRSLSLALLLILVGCGSNPSGPTPIPPSAITVSGQLTDTVTGQSLGSYSQTVASLPALITLTQPGYLPRTAAIRSASQAVDLIPESFDLGFYRQLARNGFEAPGSLEPLRVLSQSPSIYMQTTGVQPATVAAYEAAARAVVPALTGGRLSVVTWQIGAENRADQAGWIMVELVNSEETCGRARVGAAAGRVWINTAAKCHRNGDIVGTANVMAHELGHALGFRHVDAGHLMSNPVATGTPSAAERAAGAVAYARHAGNRDVDQDSLTSAVLAPLIAD